MTPKEKAKELVDKLIQPTMTLVADYEWVEDIDSAKDCALISVDEILEVVKFYERQNGRLLIDNIRVMYWQEVKKELELL